jgi:major vault protein
MIVIPPRHYALISNPCVRAATGEPSLDEFGNIKLRHGDEEIRLPSDKIFSEPFPLLPGEKLVGKVNPLQVVPPDTALRLRCLRDFEEGGIIYQAGDEWLFKGPNTYIPKVEVLVVELVKATVIKPNSALKLRARRACKDKYGNNRRVGEEWLVREVGAYLPGVDEEIVETVKAIILTDKSALHLRALRTFTDVYAKERKAGEEWLITSGNSDIHIPDVYEQVVTEVFKKTLTNRQYCVVLDYLLDGKPQLGKKELRKGPLTFFLNPGESLESGIQDVHVLSEEEALLLRAKEAYNEENRKPGDRWMIYGPRDYVPPVEVEIVEKRKNIPLDENEGIYVRDIKSGRVRAEVGHSYMLLPNEELWAKDLPTVVEDLLAAESKGDGSYQPRDKTRVVVYRAPHNYGVQIYDYKEKASRVIFGPNLVMLGPDEHFSVLSLSGDKPKRPHAIKALSLFLGPDFMTDIVTVETSDHARLSLKLSYNWQFDINKEDGDQAANLFQVPDFVGDACKAIASRVRGAVAAVPFDQFHRHSAKIIRTAVFGVDDTKHVNKVFQFPANNLIITNIDIQSVEPVDSRTRDSLQKSVQLAIEITTKSQEATARHEAERLDQEARGKIERQKIVDEAEAEKARKELLQLQAQSAAVESTGQAAAEAKARAEAATIEGESNIKQAQLKAEATRIESETEVVQLKSKQETEVAYLSSLNSLELLRAKELARIESSKFKSIVDSIGANTIAAIARSGPEMQAKLLSGLGLKSFLITDGHSPINLFNTAQGLIGAAPPLDIN